MFTFKRSFCFILFLTFYTLPASAETVTCPSPVLVQEQKISQDFDWTVSEDVTLHSILNVNNLFAVTIENNGEFLTCTYDSEGIQVRLDAKPIKVGCRFKTESTDWFSSNPGQDICLEEEKLNCRIDLVCQ